GHTGSPATQNAIIEATERFSTNGH
ncbi:hypothetical protein, partial [Frankia casuarinae]